VFTTTLSVKFLVLNTYFVIYQATNFRGSLTSLFRSPGATCIIQIILNTSAQVPSKVLILITF